MLQLCTLLAISKIFLSSPLKVQNILDVMQTALRLRQQKSLVFTLSRETSKIIFSAVI